MGAASRATFRLYYQRYITRANEWIASINTMIITIAGKIQNEENNVKITYPQPSLSATCKQLQDIITIYFNCYSKIPGSDVIVKPEYTTRMHCKLCVDEKGLGP